MPRTGNSWVVRRSAAAMEAVQKVRKGGLLAHLTSTIASCQQLDDDSLLQTRMPLTSDTND
jgi:hypothetical protein